MSSAKKGDKKSAKRNVNGSEVLTPKEEAFVVAVAAGKSLREAYCGAYNAEHMKQQTIDNKAQVVIKKPRVAAKLAELQGEVRKKAENQAVMSRVEVLHELTMVANGKGRYEAQTMDGKKYLQTANINQRLKALELLGKYYGVFTDRVDVDQTKPFEVNITVVD